MPIGLVVLAAIALFLPGIGWGLPSRDADPFLFGGQPVWSGTKIDALAGGWDADAAMGADVARHRLAKSDGPIVVNGDDAARARILVRYRLYSDQPDEMITLRALSEIDPRRGRLDPKLYQYGGLWVYGVGAMLLAAKALGAVVVRHDVAFYLDRPEEIGRFYVVARLYSAAWGLALVAAVYAVMRQLGSRRGWAAVAAALVALMPVVVNAAHEAKPHLAGAALVMLSAWAGCAYVRGCRVRMLLLAGGLCGAATGMVLWAAPVFFLVVAAAWLGNNVGGSPGAVPRRGAEGGDVDEGRTSHPRSRAAAAIGIGCAVYAITNPFVVIHLLHDPTVLYSNLQNTSAMYGIHDETGALANAAWLVVAGMSPLLAVAGCVGAIALAMEARRRGISIEIKAAILLAAVAMALLIPFVLLATGKPGEYGRFALVPDVALAMAAAAAVERFGRRGAMGLATVLLVTTLFFATRYLGGFLRDAGPNSTRRTAAIQLASTPGDRLAIAAEPAPYCLPPVNLFRWKLLLLPKWDQADANRLADATCRAVDDNPVQGPAILAAPLSWADKPILISK